MNKKQLIKYLQNHRDSLETALRNRNKDDSKSSYWTGVKYTIAELKKEEKNAKNGPPSNCIAICKKYELNPFTQKTSKYTT